MKNDNISVGIPDNTSETEITIYPNPVVNDLHVKTTNNINSVTVIDILGNTLFYSEELIAPIDFSNINPGLYIIEIITSKGRFTYKVIK